MAAPVDRAAILQLTADLWQQVEQMVRRGIKDKAGNPYNPSYYKRGLRTAEHAGAAAVLEYVRKYVRGKPSDGFKKLEAADSLDLACEALVADESRPYAHLFTDDDRAAARARLAPFAASIEARKQASRDRAEQEGSGLPEGLDALRELAAQPIPAERSVAVNRAILKQEPEDVVALNRLGRACRELGWLDEAEEVFGEVLLVDPANAIAAKHLRELAARRSG